MRRAFYWVHKKLQERENDVFIQGVRPLSGQADPHLGCQLASETKANVSCCSLKKLLQNLGCRREPIDCKECVHPEPTPVTNHLFQAPSERECLLMILFQFSGADSYTALHHALLFFSLYFFLHFHITMFSNILETARPGPSKVLRTNIAHHLQINISTISRSSQINFV